MTIGVWIGAGVATLGGVIAAFGAGVGAHQRRAERTGRQMPGRVVDIVVERRGKGREHYPVFEFLAEGGHPVRKRSAFGSGQPTHGVGDEVVVWQDLADPDRSDIVGEGRGFAILVTIVGLVFAAVGICIVVLCRLDW